MSFFFLKKIKSWRLCFAAKQNSNHCLTKYEHFIGQNELQGEKNQKGMFPYEEANTTNAVIHIYICVHVLQESRGLTIQRNNMFCFSLSRTKWLVKLKYNSWSLLTGETFGKNQAQRGATRLRLGVRGDRKWETKREQRITGQNTHDKRWWQSAVMSKHTVSETETLSALSIVPWCTEQQSWAIILIQVIHQGGRFRV